MTAATFAGVTLPKGSMTDEEYFQKGKVRDLLDGRDTMKLPPNYGRGYTIRCLAQNKTYLDSLVAKITTKGTLNLGNGTVITNCVIVGIRVRPAADYETFWDYSVTFRKVV
jgi:hypothetical protein